MQRPLSTVAPLPRAPSQFGDEACRADPGLAANQGYRPAPGFGRRERRQEALHFPGSPDQAVRHRGGLHHAVIISWPSRRGHAGLGQVRVRTTAFTHRIASAGALWDGLLGGAVRTTALVLGQPEAMQARIRAEFEALVGEYATDGSLELPISVKIASGHKTA
jgi:hypothetical protein